jgi:hypothetical protein
VLSYIASLAADMGANLTIHPSYAFGFPQICDPSKPYVRLVGNYNSQAPNFEDILLHNDVVQVSSNWGPREKSPLSEWCINYKCGNLIHHYFVPPSKNLLQAFSFANSFLDAWARNLTIVFHVRAGGSKMKVGNSSVQAIRSPDGRESEFPNLILEWAHSLKRNLTCKSPLVLVSDSLRFSSELSQLAPQGLQIAKCCVSPIHVDQSSPKSNIDPSMQQYFDLVVMARPNRIFSTSGGFAKLGASFLGFSDDKLIHCTSRTCLNNILDWLQCF